MMSIEKTKTKVIVTIILVLGVVSALPFGKKKKEVETKAPSIMQEAFSSLVDGVSGFLEFGFIWRLALLYALDAKFGIRAKISKWGGAPDSVALILYFIMWYAGNTKYNEYNKGALDAVGGKTAGLTMTISTMQLGVCAAYAGFLWLIGSNPIKLCGFQAPEPQPLPSTTTNDIVKTGPVAFCAAAAHSASVFALGGDPLFGQIVKAGEPVLSAVVNTIFYASPPSVAKACCLPLIVGGVCFASMKADPDTGGYVLKFDATALYFGLMANAFAAFKGSENKKLMTDKAIKQRYGGVGNQYAVTEILAFLISLPVMLATEGHMFTTFLKLLKTSAALRFNLVASGLAFYLYNELATMTIKKTSAVTASVANTAKRVIVLIWMSLITGKPLTFEQKVGATIAIGGVMLYSAIDDLIKQVKAKSS